MPHQVFGKRKNRSAARDSKERKHEADFQDVPIDEDEDCLLYTSVLGGRVKGDRDVDQTEADGSFVSCWHMHYLQMFLLVCNNRDKNNRRKYGFLICG